MNKQLGVLLQKEMTRKEFVTTLGFGVASVMGFSSILKLATGKSLTAHGLQQVGSTNNSYGFGAGAYGGSKR